MEAEMEAEMDDDIIEASLRPMQQWEMSAKPDLGRRRSQLGRGTKPESKVFGPQDWWNNRV